MIIRLAILLAHLLNNNQCETGLEFYKNNLGLVWIARYVRFPLSHIAYQGTQINNPSSNQWARPDINYISYGLGSQPYYQLRTTKGNSNGTHVK